MLAEGLSVGARLPAKNLAAAEDMSAARCVEKMCGLYLLHRALAASQ